MPLREIWTNDHRVTSHLVNCQSELSLIQSASKSLDQGEFSFPSLDLLKVEGHFIRLLLLEETGQALFAMKKAMPAIL